MSTIDLYYNKLIIDSGSQFQQPEPEPLRQIDVNDLLSKLLSTGIIKHAQTDSTTGMHTVSYFISYHWTIKLHQLQTC